MGRIENLSDQLSGYAEEVASAAQKISTKYNLSIDQAIKCVEIATNDMKVDVLHSIEGHLDNCIDDGYLQIYGMGFH